MGRRERGGACQREMPQAGAAACTARGCLCPQKTYDSVDWDKFETIVADEDEDEDDEDDDE